MKILQLTYTFFVILLIYNVTDVSAQNHNFYACGNTNHNKIELLDNDSKQQLKNHQKSYLYGTIAKGNTSKQNIFQVPVIAHIIRDSNGMGGLSKTSIQKALDELNIIFSEAFVNFYLADDLNFIDDSNLNEFKKGDEVFIVDRYVSGALNVFFTDGIFNLSDNSICGYNIDNIDKNIIVMKNSCAVNGSSLAHEIGHFFSLTHTHGNGNITRELVDGSNCDTTGDGICDTPADPGLSYDNVDDSCNYIGNATDANGTIYRPDTANVMSYSRKACRTHFSRQQYARMFAYYLTVKDDIFEAREISTSTTEGLENITIYPNPVTDGQINIKREPFLNNELQFQITNIAGQVLVTGITTTDAINVTSLSSGSYFLTLSNAETKITKRFIK